MEVRDGDKWVRFEPFDGYKLSFTINFAHPVFAATPQHVTIDLGEHSYIREISRARTFGFMQDVESLRASGLAMGGIGAVHLLARGMPDRTTRAP